MQHCEKDAQLTPPCEGKNLIVLASTAASRKLKFPASWRKSLVTIQAEGLDEWICFGGSGVAAAPTTGLTTLTTEAPSAHAAGTCYHIPAGQERTFDMSLIKCDNPGNTNDNHAVRMALISTGTTGYIRVMRASGEVSLNETGLV